jgi:hypothetical protein
VSGALLCCNPHLNARRSFKEVAGELINWIAESDNAPSHATPLYVKGVDDRAHNISQRVGGGQAIRNREGIEYRTDVSHMKFSCAAVQITFGSAFGHGSHPQDQSWRNSGVVRMQAQRACCREAVKSYKGERAFMRISIGSDELSLHEPHIGMEVIRGAVACVQICPCATQKQVGLCDDTTKVKDL